jgi:hypothetical protein
MKLPTLNVDVAVNTAGMKKQIAQANKELRTIGAKGLSFVGGPTAKLGALGSIGGSAGMTAISAGGMALAAAAPFKLSAMLVGQFTEAVKEGESALKSFKAGADIRATGINAVQAATLAQAADRAAIEGSAAKGWGAAFTSGSMNEFGQTGGVLGFFQDWAGSINENGKWLVAALGGVLAGKYGDDVIAGAEIATARSTAGAQAYLTQEQIDRMAFENEKKSRQQREQNT